MPMEKLVWVLITGNIRDPEGLMSCFDFLLSLQERRLISGVVFSTWIGELEKFPLLKERIGNLNLILVESEAPSVQTRGNLVHQMIQLEHGLSVCPEDCFILRMRTDKCGPQDGFFYEQVTNALAGGAVFKKCDHNRSVFKYKIGTLGGHTIPSLSAPILFFWLDRWYFGYKQDIERLVSYNVLASDFESLIPEQALFLKFFQSHWGALRYFPFAINQDFAIRKFWFEKTSSDERLAELTEFLLSKKLFRMAFLSERWILSTHFFDLQSTQEIELNINYRGMRVGCDDEIEMVKSQVLFSPVSGDINEISNYLFEKFGLPKVRDYHCIEDKFSIFKFQARNVEFLGVVKQGIDN